MCDSSLRDRTTYTTMQSNASLEQVNLSATQELTRRTGAVLSRKIWLPRLVYDALPYFYLTAGFAALFATLYISDWFWVLPHYVLFSAAICHLALAVMSKRRRYRKSESSDSND